MTVCDSYQRASAIFIGTATAESPTTMKREYMVPGKGKEVETFEQKVYRFSVEHSFKGPKGAEIDVQTGMGGGDCGFPFAKGQKYLVYAYQNTQTGKYNTGICTRTDLLSSSSEDLDFLRGLPDSATKTRISGRVTQYTNERAPEGYQLFRPMVGVKVFIAGTDKSYEAVTNEEGVYQVVGLPPGKYKVKPEVPPNLSRNEHEVTVPAGGCVAADLVTRTDGRISGKVIDNQGHPVPGARVKLLPADKGPGESERSVLIRSDSEATDKEGRYEFKELTPGKYYLGINLDGEPSGGLPYPRTYYPGSPDQERATVIVLGDGEKLSGYDLLLPSALTVRTIEGVFLWSDGTPVKPGNVALTDSEDPKKRGRVYGSAEVGAGGRFTLKGLDGVECWLHGSTYSTAGERMRFVDAVPIKVLVTEGMQPVKLVAPVPKGN